MTKQEEHWRAITPKQEKMLDLALITELNEQDLIGEESADEAALHPLNNSGGRGKSVKIIGSLTVLIFTLVLLANLLQMFKLPSLDFLSKSLELAQDQEMKKLQQAVVAIQVPGSRGTGFNIAADGLIVTNYHVVKGSKTADVAFARNKIYRSKEITGFPELDLAIIDISGEDLPFVQLEKEVNLQPGDNLIIIGNPLGLFRMVKQGELLGEHLPAGREQPVMMVKGPIHPGSSGSPVFNQAGRVVAIIFATISVSEENKAKDIIGLAVPVGQLQLLLDNHF